MFPNLKDRVDIRIVPLYLLALSLVIGIGILALIQLNQISATVNNLTNNLAVERALSKDIISQILLTRFYAHKYVRTQSQADLDLFNREFSRLETFLALADQQITNPERVEMLGRINLAVNAYGDTFEEVASLVKERQRIYGEVLDIEGRKIEDELTALRVHVAFQHASPVFLAFTNAQNAARLMDLNTDRYLEAGDERYAIQLEMNYQDVRSSFSSLEANLQDSMQRKNLADAKAAAEAYYQGFQTIHSDYVRSNELLNTMLDELDPEISNTASEIAASIEQEFKAQNEVSQTLIFQTRVVLLATTVIAILAGLGLGIMFSRYNAERLRAEQERRQYYDHLEDLVAARTAELTKTNLQLQQVNDKLTREIAERLRVQEALEQAKKAAEQANRAKSTFLANMSHELRTPLNGILGYAQILKRNGGLSEGQQEGLDIMEKSGRYLLTLISDILDLSKIEAGKMELYPAEIGLSNFLESLISMIRIRAKQKGIQCIYEPDDNLPAAVEADEKRLRQVLVNLLGNAVKFTDQGTVTLRVLLCRKDDNKLAPGAEGNIANLRFEIEDTGVGMSPEQVEKIFQPFEQVGDMQRRAGGTGLGLAISRQLVQLMGGQIEVKTPVFVPNVAETTEGGPGSLFWFEIAFPVVKNWVQPVSPARTLRIVGIKDKAPTILVVDDNLQSRRVLNNLLAPIGFNLITANNGQEGLAKATEFRPEAIITDLAMPEVDGFEMTRRIRQLPALQDTTIIATSAMVYAEDRQKSLSVGADDFISKPVDSDLVFETLQRHLGLEWIYETQAEDEMLDLADEIAEVSAVILPSAEEMAGLYELACMGDIGGIREQIDALEESDPQLKPFTTALRQLAKGFRIDRIRRLLESYQVTDQ